MRVELDRSGATVRQAFMSHNGETITWDVSAFDRKNFETEFDMFQHNNQFWEYLSAEEQTNIFEHYKAMKAILEDGANRERRITALSEYVAGLIKLHDMGRIEKWIKFESDIKWPSWLKTEYDPSTEYHVSREQTYIAGDYVKLICFAFTLRLMIPIWSEYIGRTRYEISTALKEYRAYQLLAKSDLFHCEAMEKLRIYVACLIPPEKPKSAIVSGLSSEEFPTWVLSVALIRKICISDIRGAFPPITFTATGRAVEPPTLVTYVFNHIRERIKHHGNNFVGLVNNKEPDKADNGPNSDQQLSRLEGYKIKQDISVGDTVLIEHSVDDHFKVARAIAPGIDRSLVSRCVKMRMASGKPIYDPQVTMLQWIMKPVIPPRGVMYLNRVSMARCLGVAEAVLWHFGHKILAGLITADMRANDYHIQAAGADTRARIPKEITEELMRYYPYMRKNNSKSRTPKSANQAFVALEIVADQLADSEWNLTLHESMLPELTGSVNARRFSAPHDIKVKLAELILMVARQSEQTHNQYKQLLG